MRHGRWIPTEYDSYADGSPVWDKYECSECGHEHSGEEDTLTPYCPNCGADMRMDELKPCPFCGDKQHVAHVELSSGLHYVECKRCGAVPNRLGARDYETAVKYWNSVNRIDAALLEKIADGEIVPLKFGPDCGA